jgi:hypothetical protein
MSADRKLEGKGPSLDEIDKMVGEGSVELVPVMTGAWIVKKEEEVLATVVLDTPTGNLIVKSSGGESVELTDR